MTKMTVNISEDLKLLLDESQPKPWRWKYKNVDGSLLFNHAHEALMDLHAYLLDKHLIEAGRTGVQDLVTAFRISSSQLLKEFNKYADGLLKRPAPPPKVEPAATPLLPQTPAPAPEPPPPQEPPWRTDDRPKPAPAPAPTFAFKKGG